MTEPEGTRDGATGQGRFGDGCGPWDGLIGIGSGGSFALAAARALMDIDGLDAEAIARRGLEIAAGICIYTNENVVLEKL